jgi:translation initiation factor 2 beta subunit (eIF-2beta)/eIF-5
MVDEQVLIKEIHTLPENLKEEVSHFVQFLKQKHTVTITIEPSKKRERKFGSAKGMFVMTEAFDEPLEDFSEYM